MGGTSLNTEDFINARKVGSYQLLVGICGMVTLVSDGFDIQIISYLIPQISKEWGLHAGLQGTILSAGFAGTMFGYCVLAPLSPKVGLKRAVIGYLICAGIFNIATVTAHNPPTLIAFRVATGMALGGLFPSAVALTSEYFPERLRASLVTIMYIGIPAGFLLAGWTAWLVVARFGWRPAITIGGMIPLILSAILGRVQPESLVFLVNRANDGARRAVRLMSKIDPLWALPPDTQLRSGSAQRPSLSVFELFRHQRALGTQALWIALCLNSTVYYFILTWLPLILVRIGASQPKAILASSLVNFSGIAAGFLTGPMMDFIGRYRIVLLLFGAGAASAVIVGLVLSPELLVIVPAALCLGFCVSGIQKGVSALAVRFYPTELRSPGLGWTLGIGQFGAIVGPFAAGQLVAHGWTPADLFFVMCAPMIIGGICILLMRNRYEFHPTDSTAAGERVVL